MKKTLIMTTNGEIAFIHIENTLIYIYIYIYIGCGGLWRRFIPGKLVGNQQLNCFKILKETVGFHDRTEKEQVVVWPVISLFQ
jgi:hypothetical protein